MGLLVELVNFLLSLGCVWLPELSKITYLVVFGFLTIIFGSCVILTRENYTLAHFFVVLTLVSFIYLFLLGYIHFNSDIYTDICALHSR